MLPPLLFTLCKDIHISFLPLIAHLTLAEVWATAGTIFCLLQHFWKQYLLPVFPHTNTAACMPHQAWLSSLWFPTPCHPKPGTHFTSVQYSVGAWDMYKKMTDQKFNSKATSFIYISQSQKSFQVFALGPLSTKGYKTLIPHLLKEY